MGVNPVWMPWEEALERAGSFEALLPPLREGRILARHQGLCGWPGGTKTDGPGHIPRDWWANAHNDPATGLVIFKQARGPFYFDEEFAVDLELERRRAEMLWPGAESAKPKRKRKPGPKQYAAWAQLLPHLDSLFENGTIANTEDAFHEARKWLEQKKLVWTDKTIREGIKRNRPGWPEA
jgi:hypothetical protein